MPDENGNPTRDELAQQALDAGAITQEEFDAVKLTSDATPQPLASAIATAEAIAAPKEESLGVMADLLNQGVITQQEIDTARGKAESLLNQGLIDQEAFDGIGFPAQKNKNELAIEAFQAGAINKDEFNGLGLDPTVMTEALNSGLLTQDQFDELEPTNFAENLFDRKKFLQGLIDANGDTAEFAQNRLNIITDLESKGGLSNEEILAQEVSIGRQSDPELPEIEITPNSTRFTRFVDGARSSIKGGAEAVFGADNVASAIRGAYEEEAQEIAGEVIDLIGTGDSEERNAVLSRYASALSQRQALGEDAALAKISSSANVKEAFEGLLNSPGSIATLIVEQWPDLFESTGAQLGGGLVGGFFGGLLGTPSGPGAIGTAGVGAIAGGAVAQAPIVFSNTRRAYFQGQVKKYLIENKLDFTAQNIDAFMKSGEAEKALSSANKYATVISGASTAASFVGAGGLTSTSAKLAGRLGLEVVEESGKLVVKETIKKKAIEFLGSGVAEIGGEAAGQLITEGKINGVELLLEAAASVGDVTADVGTGAFNRVRQSRKNRSQLIDNSFEVTPNVDLDNIPTSLSEVTTPTSAIPDFLSRENPQSTISALEGTGGKIDTVTPLVMEGLISQESAGKSDARSPVGAFGLTQLMPATGKQELRELRAERGEPAQSNDYKTVIKNPKLQIELGTRYLNKQLKAFNGSLDLALAAYNGGPGRVRKAIRAYAKKNNISRNDVTFENIKDKLPKETREYVPSVKKKALASIGKESAVAKAFGATEILGNGILPPTQSQNVSVDPEPVVTPEAPTRNITNENLQTDVEFDSDVTVSDLENKTIRFDDEIGIVVRRDDGFYFIGQDQDVFIESGESGLGVGELGLNMRPVELTTDFKNNLEFNRETGNQFIFKNEQFEILSINRNKDGDIVSVSTNNSKGKARKFNDLNIINEIEAFTLEQEIRNAQEQSDIQRFINESLRIARTKRVPSETATFSTRAESVPTGTTNQTQTGGDTNFNQQTGEINNDTETTGNVDSVQAGGNGQQNVNGANQASQNEASNSTTVDGESEIRTEAPRDGKLGERSQTGNGDGASGVPNSTPTQARLDEIALQKEDLGFQLIEAQESGDIKDLENEIAVLELEESLLRKAEVREAANEQGRTREASAGTGQANTDADGADASNQGTANQTNQTQEDTTQASQGARTDGTRENVDGKARSSSTPQDRKLNSVPNAPDPQAQDVGTRGERVRRWAERISKDKTIKKEDKQKLRNDNTYQPLGNQQTLKEVNAIVENNGLLRTRDDYLNNNLNISEAQRSVLGQVLIRGLGSLRDKMAKGKKKLTATSINEEIMNIIADMSQRATEAGQFIQALSMWNRFDEAGILMAAQRELTRVNKLIKSKKINLPKGSKKLIEKIPQDIQLKLIKLARENQRLIKAGKLDTDLSSGVIANPRAAIRMMEVAKVISELHPSGIGSKIRTFQTIALVLTATSRERDVVGNILNSVTDVPAELLVVNSVDSLGSIYLQATGRGKNRTRKIPIMKSFKDLGSTVASLAKASTVGVVVDATRAVVGDLNAKNSQVLANLRKAVSTSDRLNGAALPYRVYKEGIELATDLGRLGDQSTSFQKNIEGLDAVLAISRIISSGRADAELSFTDIKNLSGSVYDNKYGRFIEKAFSTVLAAGDLPFFGAAYNASLQQRLNTIDGQIPTVEILEQASMDGMKRIYADDNKAVKLTAALKRQLNAVGIGSGQTKVGLGDVLFKFPKVATNLAITSAELSPLGIVRGLYEIPRDLLHLYTGGRHGKAFNQDVFTSAISRGVVGTGGWMLAGMWFEGLGIFVDAEDEDDKIAKLKRERGLVGYQINISALKRVLMTGNFFDRQELQDGDELYSWAWAAPVAMPTVVGAEFNKRRRLGKAQDWMENITTGLATFLDMPIFQGLKKLAEGAVYNDTPALKKRFGEASFPVAGIQSALESYTEILPMFIPSLASQARRYNDSVIRETRDPNIIRTQINKVKNRLPSVEVLGLKVIPGSDTLEPKIGVLDGRPLEYEVGGFISTFFNPAVKTTFKDDKILDEINSVFTSPDDIAAQTRSGAVPRSVKSKIKISKNGRSKDLELTPKQRVNLQEFVSTVIYANFRQTIEQNLAIPVVVPGTKEKQFVPFFSAPDEDKAKYFSGFIKDVHVAGKALFHSHAPLSASKRAKALSHAYKGYASDIFNRQIDPADPAKRDTQSQLP